MTKFASTASSRRRSTSRRSCRNEAFEIDRTHDLEKLLIALLPANTTLRGLRRGLKFLRRMRSRRAIREIALPDERPTRLFAGRSGYARRAASSSELDRHECNPATRIRTPQREWKQLVAGNSRQVIGRHWLRNQ